MTNPRKNEQLDPLMRMREQLLEERRACARQSDLSGVLRVQGAIDLIDRALADELKLPH